MIESIEIEGGVTLRGFRTSGSRPGPHVLITAGIHGSEYPGILAARKLRAFLAEADIAGTVTVLPFCNPSALKGRAKAIFPEDGKNLNRMFPGDPEGSASEKTAWAITKLQDEADFYIDLHGGDLFEKLTPYVYVPGNCAPEVTAEARAAAQVLNVPVRVLSQASTGAYNSAALRGTPSILIERGACGLWEPEEVEAYFEDLKALLAHLGVIEGNAPINSAQREAPFATYLSHSEHGLWFPRVNAGDDVLKGDLLGHLEDFDGAVLAQIHAPHDGRILYMTATLSAPAGCDLVALG